ncbi:MAG TPA: alternative ribosome rescue aminoacyl-tRNA hydrolase ArfB [Kofleriaceae bacterium]|nr:alternative ribosome rescue aminoacyl-tRNA hydrolase ArfB [Kofleriaceae bacterium]
MGDLRITHALGIPDAELSESFSRSTGPGGQNVNKVESKVELRWNPATSAVLGDRDRAYLLERLARSLTASGDLIVRSSRTRDQVRNRADARERLAEIVRAALHRPRRRVATRPSRGSVERRIAGKKRRAGVKRVRANRPGDD